MCHLRSSLFLHLPAFVCQIELLESEGFHMTHPVKAHHGRVDLLETLTEVAPGDERMYDMCRILVSVGSDKFIKLWELQLMARDDVELELQLLPILSVLETESFAHEPVAVMSQTAC